MISKRDRAAVLNEAEHSAAVRQRAEQMLRDSLAAQIKHGLITPGQRLDQKELRRALEDCKVAAVHAISWERANPGQQWMPSFTDANRADGLSEQRYNQYTPPRPTEM